MIERGEQSRLALEARAAIGIAEHRVGQDLEGDVATERRVARPIDLAHAAGAEESGHFVGPEAIARRERVGPVVEDVCDRARTRVRARHDRHGVVEDRSIAGIGGQQRFDFGLQRAVVTAQVTDQCRAVFDATGHRRIEDLLHALPAIGLAHVDSWDGPTSCGDRARPFALLSSLATVDRETDSVARDFVFGEAAEIAQLDDAALPLVEVEQAPTAPGPT